MALQLKSGLVILAVVTTVWTSFCSGQTPQQTTGPKDQGITSAGEQLPVQQLFGSIQGTVVDPTGAVVGGARVQLTGKSQGLHQEVRSGADGQFSSANIAPGSFQLTITAAGFATQTFSGILHSGEIDTVGPIALSVAEPTRRGASDSPRPKRLRGRFRRVRSS